MSLGERARRDCIERKETYREKHSNVPVVLRDRSAAAGAPIQMDAPGIVPHPQRDATFSPGDAKVKCSSVLARGCGVRRMR